MEEKTPFYDIVVIGAGISGISAAYHLQDKCPNKTFTIFEGRDAIGGTWDLFKYPGIRSDSDMYTLGFPFYPWQNPKAIADGPSILQYIKETAAKFGIDKKIKFNHRVVDANWNDHEKLWTLMLTPHSQVEHTLVKCKFLMVCSGYYNYENGYTPTFKDIDKFKGQVVHPQKWTSDVNYTNKKVVVIGSGATAVTLVPEMSKLAEKVTMLQRTPTYIMTLPSVDKVAELLNKFLPIKVAYHTIRWKNILIGIAFFKVSRKWPNAVRRFIHREAQKRIGEHYDAKHFNPPYNPWDQRLCLVPDSDLFMSLKSGKAEIVTDQIEHFTDNGILLKSGKELEADLVVTATGLQLQLLGGMKVRINGLEGDSGSAHAYRGVMLSDVPNFAFTVGYTNASWTLKCDLSCRFVTKVINHMDKTGSTVCIPRFDNKRFKTEPLLDFNSGYVLRSLDKLPKQGSAHPWKVYQNYVRDLISLEWESVHDEYLQYT